MVILVHHADAVDASVDPQRPLSEQGRAQARRLAADLAARGVRPDAVWHSGKLRARLTAEAIWRACNPLAGFAAIRGLQPGDPAVWIQDLVAGETRDVILVGHMPNLSHVLQLLTGGWQTTPSTFPTHGAVALEMAGDRWVVVWSAEVV